MLYLLNKLTDALLHPALIHCIILGARFIMPH